MKVTSIIATMMVAQVSASFLEVFQGAVLSVQNSFGKLFSDVVTDVKDTVDCTILAVEHILSLSEDATARFTKKCASAKKYTQSDSQLKNNFPVLEISIANNEEYLKKELPEEIDARINATLLKYLNGYNPHDKLEDVQKELAKETERLAEVSGLVRQQLDKLSKEIHLDFTNAERKGYKPSVDSILDELKVLEAIEQSIRNSSEANEIHRLVDDVLNKLHAIESSGAKQNDKVNGILRDLEKSSNRSYKDMRQQLEDWKAEEARHLNVIKAKMDEHEKLPKHLEYAKMENTFAIIERPKISLVPIEKEIVSKTGPLSSNNTVESIQPNIVTNTDSKFLTFITEQITSTPKIAIQPSLHATSPVQINDASSVITPVSISTSSYVNEIIIDVMTTLIPQRIKEPIFDPMPDTTFTEKTLHSMNLAARQSTIELLERRTTISAMTSESATSLLVTATDPTKSSTTIPEPTTSIPMTAPELTILATTLEPTTSLAKTAIESTTNDATNLESTNSLIVTAPKPPTRFAMTPEFTTDLSLMAPESTANLTATPEPSAYPSMTPTERDTNPTTLPEPTRDLPVTTTEPATSSAVNPEPTLVLVVTTPESTRNPGTNPELSTELQVISGRKINSVMMAKSTINIPVMDAAVTTSPTMTQDPNKSLPVTASRLISFATTPEPTTNPLMTSTESTTNLTTTRELEMHLPLKTLESNLGIISELTTGLSVIASEYTSSTKTSKPIPNMLIINSDTTKRPTMPPEQTTSLPVTTSELKSFVTIPEPITNYPVTTLEPIINSATIPELTTKPPESTTEVTTYHIVKTTDIRTSAHVTNTESTSSPLKRMPKATTSLTATVREPTNSLAPNLSVINRNISMSAFKRNTSSTITPEPTTNLPVSTFQEPISSSQAMPQEPSVISTLTILEPTLTSIMRTLGPTTSSQMKDQEPMTKPAKIRETTTSRSIMTLESTKSSTEAMSKPTTGSLRTTLKLITNNRNFQHPFNLPTHRPEVPTPSLNVFLNYIDRKEGFTKPIIQSTGVTTTSVATPIGAEVKILPLTQSSYSKPLFDVKNGPVNAKLNAFFSHISAKNISSPYARSDYEVPMNITIPGLPKISHNMPLPYIMKPSIALNKNDHPRPLSFSRLRPQSAHDESPYGGNNNTPPLGKGMPQKSHILPQRRNDQNTPIQSSDRISTNLSSSLGSTTNKPVPMSKSNNDDDADYKSFFHLSSKDSEAHRRALKEAKKLIEDSKRAQRIINNIFKKKNKGKSVLNFPKSLKIGK